MRRPSLFLDLARGIRVMRNKPKVVVLENVAGLKSRSHTVSAPLEFVLRGKVRRGTHMESIGLELIPNFMMFQVELDAKGAGLPHLRRRIFFVRVHPSVIDDASASQLLDDIRIIHENPRPQQHLDDFVKTTTVNPRGRRVIIIIDAILKTSINQ